MQQLQERTRAEPPVEPDGLPATQGVRREWTVSVNGAGLRVEEAGAGAETVVFSPALFTNRALFDVPVAALSADYRCIRYDHRGQGDSGLGAPQPSRHLLGTEGLYDDAVALMDQLGVESCHWVGASVGGFVGVRLAARLPERIRSLTLIGFSTRRVPSANLRQIDLLGWMVRASRPLGPVGAAVRRRVTEQVMRNMFGTTFMSDPSRSDDRDKWRQRFMATIVPEAMPMLREVFGHPGNPPELLSTIQAPTLLISGEDELAGVDEADNDPLQARRVIPGARMVTIPGAGHMVLVEQPEAGTTAVTAFIRSVSAALPATGGSST
jgi:pimeloyl-ACP methyl ester carboxylesterase